MDLSMENFTMMDFNYFDVSIASIVLLLAIKGFINGFVKEAFGILGLIGGVYLASRKADLAGDFIHNNFLALDNPSLLKLLGFLAILIIVWLSFSLIGMLISKLLSASGLGFFNRLLGFLAGGGKYFLIFALIVTALSNVKLFKDNIEKYVKDSVLYPYLKETGAYIINLEASKLTLDMKKSKNATAEIKADKNATN